MRVPQKLDVLFHGKSDLQRDDLGVPPLLETPKLSLMEINLVNWAPICACHW